MILQSTDELVTAPKRIVSLVPSLTELLHYLGLETETVGITKFCIHPDEWFRSKTRVGGTKTVDIEKIKQLQPDLIIANKEENVQQQVIQLAQDFSVWVTDVNNLQDALQMTGDIGTLTRKSAAAKTLIQNIENEFLKIQPLSSNNEKTRTAYLIWKKPYMTVGVDTYINSMLQFAGLTNVFSHKTRYPEVTVEEIRAHKCELLLLSSEPYPFKQQHIDELQQQLPGVKILLVDGEMFSWYGSKLLEVPAYLLNLKKLPGAKSNEQQASL